MSIESGEESTFTPKVVFSSQASSLQHFLRDQDGEYYTRLVEIIAQMSSIGIL